MDNNRLSDEDIKRAMKEALKEWLDERFATFGRWSFYAVASVLFAGVAYFIILLNGFHK